VELIPAIDLLSGHVVRLRQGSYDAATEFADDPVELVERLHAEGATRIHVVDLDGAKAGAPRHVRTIEAMLRAAPVRVQVGGGVRDPESVARWLGAGADRVVIGTVAVRDPALARGLCEAHPGRVVVAVDARAGEVSIDGWRAGAGRPVVEVARDADAWGAAALLYTCIERDGMGSGPDVEGTVALARAVRAEVIASGGIGTLAHVRQLAEAGVRAAVCGRALLEGAFSLADAMRASATPEVGRAR